MKNVTRVCICLMTVGVLAFPVRGAENDRQYAIAFRVVGYAEDDAEELKPVADEVAKLVDTEIIVTGQKNPVCCVWLELTGTPNPGLPGYIINHQPGGTVIQASNLEQMDLALKRWQAASKPGPLGPTYPIGLMTSYKVLK